MPLLGGRRVDAEEEEGGLGALPERHRGEPAAHHRALEAQEPRHRRQLEHDPAADVAQAALAYGILREMDPDERFVLLACDSACRIFPENGQKNATRAWVQLVLEFLSHLDEGG